MSAISKPAGQSAAPAGPKLNVIHPPTAAEAPFEPRVPSEDELAALREASERLESATPEEIITWAVENYQPRLGMATAFGPEGCVILSMIAKVDPSIYVFNLETGYQFQETLDLRDRIAEKYGIEVELRKPRLTVEEFEKEHGGPLYKTQPDKCCFERKTQGATRGLDRTGCLDERHSSRPECRPGEGGHRGLGQEVRPGEGQPLGQLDEGPGVEADHRREGAVQSAARQRLSEHRLPAVHAGGDVR